MRKEIENEVIKIVSKITNIKFQKKKDKETLLKFRWDSLQHIRIIIAIEKKFKVKIGTSIVAKLNSIASIVKFLKK